MKDHATAAARALADLTMFEAIDVLVQSSLIVRPSAYRACQRITAICQAEKQKALREYDRERAAISERMGGND